MSVGASSCRGGHRDLGSPQPNEVDLCRVVRAIGQRRRYRYVSPQITPVEGGGYRIASPCCSRNIDKDGGVIDIALLHYLPGACVWQLYRKDHEIGQWQLYSVCGALTEVLAALQEDPERVFWQ